MGTKINWTRMIQQDTLGQAAWVQLQPTFLCIESGPHLLQFSFSCGLLSSVMCLSSTFELINDFIHVLKLQLLAELLQISSSSSSCYSWTFFVLHTRRYLCRSSLFPHRLEITYSALPSPPECLSSFSFLQLYSSSIQVPSSGYAVCCMEQFGWVGLLAKK